METRGEERDGAGDGTIGGDALTPMAGTDATTVAWERLGTMVDGNDGEDSACTA